MRPGMEALGATMVWAGIGIAVLMLATWLISLPLRDVSWIDVAWGLAFVVAGWAALLAGEGDGTRSAVMVVLVSLWGLRLAGFIANRKRGEGEEDRRYREMRERDGPKFPLI